MISVLSIGYLYWSSSWQWQAHIRGCKLLRPLPRAEMSDFGPVFAKCIFYGYDGAPKKFWSHFFGFYPPKQAILPNPLRPACHFAEIEVVPRQNPNSRKAMTGALYMLNRDHFEPWRRAVPVWSCNANKLLVVDHQSMVFRYQICQFLGTTPISAKWNSATTIPAKWPYPPKKTHLCGNLCGNCWWNFFRSPRTLGQRSFWKKRHPIWSTFAPVAPFTICNPIYGLTTLYYISQPRSQMKYSAAMYYSCKYANGNCCISPCFCRHGGGRLADGFYLSFVILMLPYAFKHFCSCSKEVVVVICFLDRRF